MMTGMRIGAAAVAASASHASAPTHVAQLQQGAPPHRPGAPPPKRQPTHNMLGSGVNSFSFDTFGDTTLKIFDNAGDLEIRIEGTIFGGVHDGMGGYVGGGQAYAIDFTYATDVNTTASGYKVLGVNNVLNTGTLTALDAMGMPESGPESVFTVTDDDNNSFIFQSDGHRLAGDSSSWVGRGWLTMDDSGANTGGTQDWLFTATVIPAPGAAALFALGLGVATRRRR